jgi:hypothetical protein
MKGLRLRSSPALDLVRFVEPIRLFLRRLWDPFSRRYRTRRRLPFQLGVLLVAHVERRTILAADRYPMSDQKYSCEGGRVVK